MAKPPVRLQPEEAEIFRRLEALYARGGQRKLARALDLEDNKISNVKGGIRKFTARELDRARRWLTEQENQAGKGPAQLPDVPPTLSASAGETVAIASLDMSLSMGPGTEIDDYIESTPVQFDLGLLRSITRTAPSRLRLANGIGDSMFPTLLDSDLVMIDTTQNRLNLSDRVYAISLFGAGAIKRLRTIGPNRVLVISDNPAVENQEVEAEDLRIAGRIIWCGRGL